MPRRPRNPRGVIPVDEAALTGFRRVFADTSFIVNAVVESQPNHDQANAFLGHLADSGATLVVSPLMDLELPQALSHIVGREAGRHRSAGLADGRIRRRSASLTRTASVRWTRYLDTIRWIRSPVEPAIAAAPAIIFSTGLRSYDAAMAATAIAHRCDAIATFDVDVGRLHEDDMPVLVTDARRARHVRRPRSSARRI